MEQSRRAMGGEWVTTMAPAARSRASSNLNRLAAEGPVSDGGDLVHQVGVEGQAHGDPEREARLHACRVGAEGPPQGRAQFGEVGHKVEERGGLNPVDAGHESGVLLTGQIGVEGTTEAHRIGDGAFPPDTPGGRPQGPGDELQEGALARPVAAQQSDGAAAGKGRRQVRDHGRTAGAEREGLADAL